MNNEFYNVYIDNIMVAKEMALMHALILTKALFAEYYNEPDLDIHIKRNTAEDEDDTTEVEEINE